MFTPTNGTAAVLTTTPPQTERSENPLLGLLLMALGAFYIFAPHAAWYLSHGWHFKDAEPSDAALLIARITGVTVVIFGLFILFAG